jgi:hypothetical protein
MTFKERILAVLPASNGEVVSWWSFRQGKFKPPLLGNFGLTTALTDAVTTMWQVCREIDPECVRVVIVANGFTTNYFKLEFRAERFLVVAERKLVRGGFPFNPLAAELARNHEIVFRLRSTEDSILQTICDRFRSVNARSTILQEAWL